jgi:hypothetical protein
MPLDLWDHVAKTLTTISVEQSKTTVTAGKQLQASVSYKPCCLE